jgi:hypothetical protein
MRTFAFSLMPPAVLLACLLASPAAAQSTDAESRQAIVEQAQGTKSSTLHPRHVTVRTW